MRILLTVHQFFPTYSSGTEVLTYSVARELKKRGYEVYILTGHPTAAKDNRMSDTYVYNGFDVYRFYYHSCIQEKSEISELDLRNNNNYAEEYFSQVLATCKPDIIHFFHLDRLGSGLIDIAFGAGIPAFMTPTDFWAVCPMGQMLLSDGTLCPGPSVHSGNCIQHLAEMTQKNIFGSFLDWMPPSLFDLIARFDCYKWMPNSLHCKNVQAVKKWSTINIEAFNKLEKIISPNRFMSEKLIQHGVSSNVIVNSSFGVEKTENGTKTFRSTTHNPIRIGYIATLAPHKGCHILIQAFTLLPKGSAILKIYGKLNDFPNYVAYLKELTHGDCSVDFCGTFPNSEISKIVEDLDVMVVPSLWYENTPLVVYSAQQACCPVVASHLPGLSEVVNHEFNGLLFDVGSVEALSNALFRLIHEPNLIPKLSMNSKQPKSTSCYVDDLLEIWSVK